MKIGEKITLNNEEYILTAFESGYFTAEKAETKKAAKPQKDGEVKKTRTAKQKVEQGEI